MTNKHSIFLTIFLFTVGVTFAQKNDKLKEVEHNLNEAKDYIEKIEKQAENQITKLNESSADIRQLFLNRRHFLMTYPSLNIFMARKVNTYLTGSGDLALNKGYLIVDPTDGRLYWI